MKEIVTAALLGTLSLLPLAARANGRFPQAQHVVLGPGARDDLVLLRATFGLLLSGDGGGRFEFLCEDAWQFLDGFDPPVIIGARGAMLVGLHDGLTRSRDGCAPARDADLDGMRVADLASNATAEFVVAALVTQGAPHGRFARSSNGGERFDLLPQRLDGVALATVEVGSPDGSRLYASGALADTNAHALWRSDDGGDHWVRTAARFGPGEEVFISGVDPRRPEVVYLRVTLGADGGLGGTALLRSDDGGDHFAELARTRGPMRGFAIRDDGATLWIGGPSDGVLRSDGAGPFRSVSSEPVECLRWHAGSIWACGTFAPGAVLLWRASGDDPLSPALRWSDVQGPPARCAPGSITREICPLRWQAVRGVIQPGRPDASIDVPGDAGTAPPPRGCDCSAGRSSDSAWPLGLGLALVAALFRGRARGGPRGIRGPRGRSDRGPRRPPGW